MLPVARERSMARRKGEVGAEAKNILVLSAGLQCYSSVIVLSKLFEAGTLSRSCSILSIVRGI